jgi:hypothetical protein
VHAHRRLRSLTTACSNRKQHPTDDGSVLHPKREVKSTRHYARFRSPERLSSLRTNCLTPWQHGILILRRQFGTLNHKCLRRLEFRRARSTKRRSSATRGRFARVNTDVVELAILRHTALLNPVQDCDVTSEWLPMPAWPACLACCQALAVSTVCRPQIHGGMYGSFCYWPVTGSIIGNRPSAVASRCFGR